VSLLVDWGTKNKQHHQNFYLPIKQEINTDTQHIIRFFSLLFTLECLGIRLRRRMVFVSCQAVKL
jgi:hypothetical protein